MMGQRPELFLWGDIISHCQLLSKENAMPLAKGKSEKSFKKNIKTEVNALKEKGASPKKAVAIAYNVKRKAGRKK